MAKEHLYGIEFKDIPNNNQYLGAGLFRKTATGYESYADLRGTKVRFPVEFHDSGVMWEATYPGGFRAYVDFRIFSEFDFDPDTPWF